MSSAADAAGPSPEALPCEWCGRPVEQPESGRRRKYCRRSCRQRAYEQRQAAQALELPAGTVLLSAAEATAVSERAYVLRCAAEDLETALAEGASTAELRSLAAALVASARSAERLR